MTKIKRQQAAIALLIIFSCTVIFHLLIITGIIPYQYVWGGKLQNKAQMYIFELLSIAINGFLIYIVLQKNRYVKRSFSRKWINNILWGFTFLFVLNTIGNLFAENNFEKILGTLLTACSAFFCWVLVKSKEPYNNHTH